MACRGWGFNGAANSHGRIWVSRRSKFFAMVQLQRSRQCEWRSGYGIAGEDEALLASTEPPLVKWRIEFPHKWPKPKTAYFNGAANSQWRRLARPGHPPPVPRTS